jgi:mortality factor 4-like protein 1
MDLQSVNRLREELSKLTNWLGRNASEYLCTNLVGRSLTAEATYFTSEYETPGTQYVEKARGV